MLKSNSNFVKKHIYIDFSYILPNSSFTEPLSMPASEYSNKCNKRYFSVWQEWKYKKWTCTYQKKRKFEEKVIKKGEQFLNIYRPVNEWHAIELAGAHTPAPVFIYASYHCTCKTLYDELKTLFHSSPSVLIINSFMFF